MNTITQTIGPPALGATPGKATSGRTSGDGSNPMAPAANGPAAPVDVEATLSSRATPQAEAAIDAGKVARLREAIAQGTYQIDAHRAARTLLSMEHSLG